MTGVPMNLTINAPAGAPVGDEHADGQGFAGRPLSTLNQDGSRRWIRPRPSPGRMRLARRVVAYGLIAVFTVLPYVKIGGKPAILLDIGARRFTVFGRTFLPTDTLALALLMLAIFVGVFLVTALAGRVWCGWACPQTVYMEFLFRPVERFFRGTPGRRKNRLQASGAGAVLQAVVYLVLALYLAHTFLAYFVGVERLAQWVRQSPWEHPVPFMVMLVTTGLMLFDFGYFREQVCIVACPYGRFQSVMLDRNSLIVSYDRRRGEPRGKAKKQKADAGRAPGDGGTRLNLRVLGAVEAPRGDCVDCGLCVATCPTGIDIRDGLQLECINCAQCIDACDAVMSKLGRPTGLIRYSSQAAMEGQRVRLLRPRVAVYAAVLAALVTVLGVVLSSASPADVTVLRGLGRPFTQLPTGEIGNPVRIKIVNRTDAPAVYTIAAAGEAEGVRIVCEEPSVSLKAGETQTVPAMIVAPASSFSGGAFDAVLRVSDGAAFTRDVPYRMLGPGGRPAGATRAPAQGDR